MTFTPFLDDLALIEVLLILVGVLFAYAGVYSWWAIRSNDPKGVRAVLDGLAVPLGVLGASTLVLALWGEMTWPFLNSDGMGGYNIFFFDPLVLLGIVLVAYAVSARLGTKLQYVGLISLVAGGATAFYGYTGYTATPAFTTHPFDTLLLYLAFAAMGVAAFPATFLTDHYLAASAAGRPAFVLFYRGQPVATPHPFGALRSRVRGWRHHRGGVRGAQPVAPMGVAAAATVAPDQESVGFRFPYWAQLLVLLFPLFAGLAAIAAFGYFGTTLPMHLGSGAAGAP